MELRIQRHNESALKVAAFLAEHSKISSVHYPGLPSHPDHEIAKRQMSGFGGVSSLANQPITNTHAALSQENRAKAGISESLVRLSVGIEKVDLIIQDLGQALESI